MEKARNKWGVFLNIIMVQSTGGISVDVFQISSDHKRRQRAPGC